MSACQTWATSSRFRHPWCDAHTMKRKRGDNDTPLISPPITKRRRRYNDLEAGFAYLSLTGTDYLPHNSIASDDTLTVQEISALAVMDAEMSSAPSSPSLRAAYFVEEPTIPEINMKPASWYEPERDRIVITDLDSFTQSDDEDERDVSINPALLDKIRANAIVDRSQVLSAPIPSTSQALVLFKPWFLGCGTDEIRKEGQLNRECAEKVKAAAEDDAMDVEI